MWTSLIKKAVAPFMGRGGAVATGWLVANGVPNDTATAFTAGAIAVAGLAFDVVVAIMATRRAVNAR